MSDPSAQIAVNGAPGMVFLRLKTAKTMILSEITPAQALRLAEHLTEMAGAALVAQTWTPSHITGEPVPEPA